MFYKTKTWTQLHLKNTHNVVDKQNWPRIVVSIVYFFKDVKVFIGHRANIQTHNLKVFHIGQ